MKFLYNISQIFNLVMVSMTASTIVYKFGHTLILYIFFIFYLNHYLKKYIYIYIYKYIRETKIERKMLYVCVCRIKPNNSKRPVKNQIALLYPTSYFSSFKLFLKIHIIYVSIYYKLIKEKVELCVIKTVQNNTIIIVYSKQCIMLICILINKTPKLKLINSNEPIIIIDSHWFSCRMCIYA